MGMNRVVFNVISMALLASFPLMADDDDDNNRRNSGRNQRNQVAQDEEDGPARMKPKKERRIGGRAVDILYEKEIQALEEAAKMLDGVRDAKSAQDIGLKLSQMFSNRYVLIGGDQFHLEELAKAQNEVTMKMRAIRHKPYFQETRLPEAWRYIVVPSSRRQSTSLDK